MHIGEKITVVAESANEKNSDTKRMRVKAKVVWIHPEGRFATAITEKGYKTTVYPSRRGG